MLKHTHTNLVLRVRTIGDVPKLPWICTFSVSRVFMVCTATIYLIAPTDLVASR